GADESALRAAGLSRQKLSHIRDLARHVEAGTLRLDEGESMSDDEIETGLGQVKGSGRWSARMVLMFRRGRPDVFPEGDLGVRKGVELMDELARPPSPAELATRALRWSPYRSVAAWYLWRLVDTATVADDS